MDNFIYYVWVRNSSICDKIIKSTMDDVAGASGSTQTWRGSKPTMQAWEWVWSVRNCRLWVRRSHWASPPPPSLSLTPLPSRSEQSRHQASTQQSRTELKSYSSVKIFLQHFCNFEFELEVRIISEQVFLMIMGAYT